MLPSRLKTTCSCVLLDLCNDIRQNVKRLAMHYTMRNRVASRRLQNGWNEEPIAYPHSLNSGPVKARHASHFYTLAFKSIAEKRCGEGSSHLPAE